MCHLDSSVFFHNLSREAETFKIYFTVTPFIRSLQEDAYVSKLFVTISFVYECKFIFFDTLNVTYKDNGIL